VVRSAERSFRRRYWSRARGLKVAARRVHRRASKIAFRAASAEKLDLGRFGKLFDAVGPMIAVGSG
jgi:hypothetical protein